MNEISRRVVVGALFPGLALAVVVGTLVATWSALPDPLATHWAFDGNPDDSTSRTTFAAATTAVVGLTALAASALSARRGTTPGDLSAPVAIVTFLQWLFAGVTVLVATANVDAAEWTAADELSPLLGLAVAGGAAVIASGAARTAGGIGRPVDTPSPAPQLGSATGERVVWIGRARGTWPLVLGGLLAAAGTVLLLTAGWLVGLLLVGSAGVVGLFSSIRVVVDRHGLTVRYGPGNWPRTRIPLAEIVGAEATEIRPARHGGWGYRGSLRVFRRASVVIRAGDGIALELHGARRFSVTVDDAATGAEVLGGMVRTGSVPAADES